ncbi:MAG: SRPBCC family protein [Pseudomonadota bacterium]
MPNLTIIKELNASYEQVWEILDDFGNTHRSHPIVKHSEIVDGPPRGLNAERRCDLYDGKNFAQERITGYQPGSKMRIEVVDGTFPMKEMIVTIAVKPSRLNRTAIKLNLTFTPKFGPIGAVMGHLAMKPQFKKMLTLWLQGVEDHANTGRLVLEGGKLGQPLPNAA